TIDLLFQALADLPNGFFRAGETELRHLDEGGRHYRQVGLSFLQQLLVSGRERIVKRTGAGVILTDRFTHHLDQLIQDRAGARGIDLAARWRASTERVDEGIEHAVRVLAERFANRAVHRADDVLIGQTAFAPLLHQPVRDRFAQVGGVLRRPALDLALGE